MNNAEKQEWEYLLKKYISGSISKNELSRLLRLTEENSDEGFNDTMLSLWHEAGNAGNSLGSADMEKFHSMMKEADIYFGKKNEQRKGGSRGPWYIAAAIAGIMLSVSLFFYYAAKEKTPQSDIAAKNEAPLDFSPGRSGAILKLSDGEEILLDSAENGLLAVQGKTKITNTNGQIQYRSTNADVETLYNTISTPRGRQYRLELSDGTKVWLNAASSIRYPTAFSGEERRVSITGEAYFEVSASFKPNSNTRRSFIVQIESAAGKKGEVEALGTQFNINAYDDEPEISATLTEGSIKLIDYRQRWKKLQPGQQARLNKYDGNIQVEDDVDTDAVLAWKNGFFSFNNTDMDALLRQIERWYDIDIEYSGILPDRKFGGKISRENNVSEILKIMEESNMRFRIENKKIIILP